MKSTESKIVMAVLFVVVYYNAANSFMLSLISITSTQDLPFIVKSKLVMTL